MRMTISSAKVNASEKVVSPSICLRHAGLDEDHVQALDDVLADADDERAHHGARVREPMPPNTAATKAFRPGMAPEV